MTPNRGKYHNCTFVLLFNPYLGPDDHDDHVADATDIGRF